MQFAVLGAVARLKLLLTIRHYRRQWGNACSIIVVLFSIVLGTIFGGAVLYVYCHGPDVAARDQAFAWTAWILAAMWLLSPLLQFDAQRQLDLGGLRLAPLTGPTFTGAVLLDGVLSPLGILFLPLLAASLACFSRTPSEVIFCGLSLLMLMGCLVGLGQAIFLWASRLLASRRFTDAAFIAGAVVFVLLQSINIYFQSERGIAVPDWLHVAGLTLKSIFEPLMIWLFPGLAWRATAAVSAGDIVGAVTNYGLLFGQMAICFWLAGIAARQFYAGELESGGTASRAKPAKAGRKGVSLIGAQLGALFHRERIYLLRDPVLKRLFFQTMIGVLYFAAMIVFMGFRRAGMPDGVKEILSSYGLLGMSVLLAGMESSMLFNKFGYDGGLLVNSLLTPVDRRHVLTAKSLFLLAHFGSVNLLFVIVLAITLKAPLLFAVTAALMVCANTAIVDVMGNFVSILYPFTYRRKGSRIKAVMPQPGCGYIFVYSVVWQACNLAVLPASAALALGAIFGGVPGLLLGMLIAGLIVYAAYKYGTPYAARLMEQREGVLIEVLTRSAD